MNKEGPKKQYTKLSKKKSQTYAAQASASQAPDPSASQEKWYNLLLEILK